MISNNSRDLLFSGDKLVLLTMKIWAILFVACVLMVGWSDEVHADLMIAKNRKLFSSLVDRVSPGGPTPCYHCMAANYKARQATRAHDMESGFGVEATRDRDINGR